MRLILSDYAGVSPEGLVYCEEGNRKPGLAGPAGDVRFNLTHSEGLALLAVARALELGVDMERVRPMPGALSLAQRFFAPEEISDLQSVWGTPDGEPAFFRCWTRKEAVLKASGAGLRFPLSAFAVTLLPGEPARVRRDDRESIAQHDWTLLSFEPAAGYVAALAHAGEARPYRLFDWTS
jgi:4'-phosphopantetheinyl transferase